MEDVVNTALDLFTVPPVQTSVEGIKYVTYQPLTSLKGEQPIEFEISGTGNEYIDTSLIMLYTRNVIKTLANEKLKDSDVVGPVNNFLHSQFDRVDLYVGDCLVTPSANNYAYNSIISAQTTYGSDASKSHLQSSMYFKDTPGEMNSLTDNKGFAKRKGFASKSKEFEMYGSLYLDFFNISKYLLNGVSMRLKLNRAKSNFCLMGNPPAAGSYKSEILEAILFVPKIQVAPKILLAHEQALSLKAAQYNYTRTETKIFTISPNILNTSIDNVYLGTVPTRVIIGFVNHQGYNGDLVENPFNFEHFNLNYISLFLNSEQIPSKPLKPNFDKGRYVRSYYSLFTGSNTHYSDKGVEIGLEDFPRGYALYCFDLTQDHSASQIEYWNLDRQGQLRLEIGFDKSTTKTLSCVVFSEFRALLQIDKNRNVAVVD